MIILPDPETRWPLRWHFVVWRLRRGESVPREQLLAAIADHPSLGAAVASIFDAKRGRPRKDTLSRAAALEKIGEHLGADFLTALEEPRIGRPWKMSHWNEQLNITREVSLRAVVMRHAGEKGVIEKAIREVARRRVQDVDKVRRLYRRIPREAPELVRALHASLKRGPIEAATLSRRMGGFTLGLSTVSDLRKSGLDDLADDLERRLRANA